MEVVDLRLCFEKRLGTVVIVRVGSAWAWLVFYRANDRSVDMIIFKILICAIKFSSRILMTIQM